MRARRSLFLRIAVPAIAAICLSPAGVAHAVPVNNTPPELRGTVLNGAITTTAVGSDVSCSNGDWSNGDTFEYEFLRDGTPIGAGFGASSVYTVAQADFGTELSCAVRATDSSDASTATANSSNQAMVLPGGSVSASRFSGAFSGHITD